MYKNYKETDTDISWKLEVLAVGVKDGDSKLSIKDNVITLEVGAGTFTDAFTYVYRPDFKVLKENTVLYKESGLLTVHIDKPKSNIWAGFADEEMNIAYVYLSNQ